MLPVAAEQCLERLPAVRPPDDRRRATSPPWRRRCSGPDDHPGAADRLVRAGARGVRRGAGTRSRSPTAPRRCTPPLRPPASGPGTRCSRRRMSFVASANCALFVGARPVFVDIDPVTANLDLPARPRRGLTGRRQGVRRRFDGRAADRPRAAPGGARRAADRDRGRVPRARAAGAAVVRSAARGAPT